MLAPSVDAAAPGLLEDLLGRGTRVRMQVRGVSMAPHLVDGDLVEIAPLSDRRPCLGDLLLFRDARGGLVLHRVLRRWRDRVQTGGDALRALDASVATHRVLGRVCAIHRGDGRAVDLDGSFRRTWTKTFGALMLARAALRYKLLGV